MKKVTVGARYYNYLSGSKVTVDSIFNIKRTDEDEPVEFVSYTKDIPNYKLKKTALGDLVPVKDKPFYQSFDKPTYVFEEFYKPIINNY